jgi:hypothetical protein
MAGAFHTESAPAVVREVQGLAVLCQVLPTDLLFGVLFL